jgi:hypothetical protein
MVATIVVNTMTALVAILAYGLAVGVAGLILAFRERTRRKARGATREYMLSMLSQSLHGRLRTDTGEELEVYLQKAGLAGVPI